MKGWLCVSWPSDTVAVTLYIPALAAVSVPLISPVVELIVSPGGNPVALVDANKKVHILGVSAPAYASYVGQELRFTGTHGKFADVFMPEKLEVKEDGKWVEKKLPKGMM